MPERLHHQVVGIEKNANVEQPAGLKLREVREPQVDRLVRVQRRQRIAHHRRSRILAQHDRLAIEAVDPYVFRDLPAYLEHGVFTATRAEKRKHVDRAIDHPVDVVIDLGLQIFWLAFIDRAMQRA